MKRNPDLVYGRSLYGCSLSALILNKKTVFEIHGENNGKGKKEFLFKRMLKSKHFVRLVVISEALSQYYQREWHIPQNKIFVAHDGADIYDNTIVKEIDVGTTERNVGYFGSLYAGKGMELIIEIAKRMNTYTFHIFGGKEKEVEHWKIRTKNIHNIKYYGYVNQIVIKEYAAKMNVLLAPYQTNVFTNTEGTSADIGKYMSPLKIFEYMSFERPMICSDLPVIREVLDTDVDCILCQVDDINSWCLAIQKLCNNRTLALQIAKKAKQKLETEYTWEKRARNVLNKLP